MASTYSDLKIELIGTGEQTGTWGTSTNNNFSVAVGEAITGSADVAFSSADVTVTLADTNTAQTARNLRLNLTGTSGGARNLILGSGCQIEKLYLINNGLADAVTVKNTSGTGIAVPSGKTMFVFNNGTNVVDATTHLTSLTLGTPLAVASGGTGTATPSLVAGTNISVSGSFPNQTINAATSSGTVSSVNLTAGTAISVSGGPITTSGSITVNNTGVTSIVAGTGISISGATGAVTITNSSPGAVTSVNGQTGAVTTTSVDSIGSTMMLYYGVDGTATINTRLYVNTNDTISGSSLRYNPTVGLENPSIGGFPAFFQTSTPVYAAGGTALSGTWRVMSLQAWFSNLNQGCYYISVWNPILMVRVS